MLFHELVYMGLGLTLLDVHHVHVRLSVFGCVSPYTYMYYCLFLDESLYQDNIVHKSILFKLIQCACTIIQTVINIFEKNPWKISLDIIVQLLY